MEHSTIGASGAHRWFNCPGSVKLIDSLPYEVETSVYAREGTAAHNLAQYALEQREPTSAFVGSKICVEGHEIEVTEEMAEHVSLYKKTIIEDLNEEYLSIDDLNIERKFHLQEVHSKAFGTNDASFGDTYYNLLRVYDLKYGSGVVVEVLNNVQLLFYALGAPDSELYDEIELVVVQPRAYHPDGPVRRWRFPQKVLQEFKKELKSAVKRVFADDPPLATGSWCKFCDAAGICPLRAQEANEIAVSEFSPEPGEFPKPEALPMDVLLDIMAKQDRVEDFLKAVRMHLFKLAENGEDVPGHKLVRRRAHRKWKDPKKLEKDFAQDDRLYKKSLKSPAQLEKVFGNEVVAEYWATPETGHELVPESDKREPVLPAAVNDFLLEEDSI